jgi:hypothetical protein
MNIEEITKEIRQIKERNKSVEADKAWEVSWLRKVLIAIFTYLSLGIYMWAIRITDPWLNAIVPTIGFLLSTATLPWFKNWWLKRR